MWMSLEELLRDRIVQRIKPNKKLAKRNLKLALRDLSVAQHLLDEETTTGLYLSHTTPCYKLVDL